MSIWLLSVDKGEPVSPPSRSPTSAVSGPDRTCMEHTLEAGGTAGRPAVRSYEIGREGGRMSDPCEEPRFTIEQIDLLQRLWRSGMTQAEIVHALDTLERLERQHSRLPSPRSRQPPPRSSSSSTTSTATQTCFPGNGASPTPSNLYRTSPPLLATTTTPRRGRRTGLVAMANGKLSPPRFPVAMIGSSGGVVAQSYGFETSEEDLEFEEKVEELMRMDSAVIKEEIKNFLGNRRISQAVVAQVNRSVSQTSVEELVRAGSPTGWCSRGSDLSDQKKRAFYRWYLLEKDQPSHAARTDGPGRDGWSGTKLRPRLAPCQGGSRLRRGSRSPGRKECLSVMESYFSDNQYPDVAKREEIASACNAVIQKPKRSDLERVTSLKVYNWFANRTQRDEAPREHRSSHLGEPWYGCCESRGHSNSDEVTKRVPRAVGTTRPAELSLSQADARTVSFMLLMLLTDGITHKTYWAHPSTKLWFVLGSSHVSTSRRLWLVVLGSSVSHQSKTVGSEVFCVRLESSKQSVGTRPNRPGLPPHRSHLFSPLVGCLAGLGRGGCDRQRGNPLTGRCVVVRGGLRQTLLDWTVVLVSPLPLPPDEPTNHSSPTEVQDPISWAANQLRSEQGSTANDIKTETMEDD
ncbi:Homeobox-containing protein 1 [Merluccius polli]|uniref:Homeobox-containing protein 1 n=1 Tax=Merluccius polli TaxID=89951 RepID=A0AA47NNM7_MERPO|nr:Homeobox-containing protein 1 [Merluccius polli]